MVERNETIDIAIIFFLFLGVEVGVFGQIYF